MSEIVEDGREFPLIGFNIRDRFAIAALRLTGCFYNLAEPQAASDWAYVWADAMLKAREKDRSELPKPRA